MIVWFWIYSIYHLHKRHKYGFLCTNSRLKVSSEMSLGWSSASHLMTPSVATRTAKPSRSFILQLSHNDWWKKLQAWKDTDGVVLTHRHILTYCALVSALDVLVYININTFKLGKQNNRCYQLWSIKLIGFELSMIKHQQHSKWS